MLNTNKKILVSTIINRFNELIFQFEFEDGTIISFKKVGIGFKQAIKEAIELYLNMKKELI